MAFNTTEEQRSRWFKQDKHRHSLKIDHCDPTPCLTSCIRNSHCEGNEFIDFCQLEPSLSVGTAQHAGKYCNLRWNLSTRVVFPSTPAWVLAVSACYRVITILGLYLLDLDCLEVPVAQGVQGVLQAPQHCFLEYRGFQGYPVAPGDPGAQGARGGLAQNVFSLGREKAKWLAYKQKKTEQ